MAFHIKRGDTSPSIASQLQDGAGEPVNLVNATVRFHMRKDPYNLTVDAPATILGDGSTGEVRYDWAPGDTADTGTYRAEWETEYADGTVETFPNDGYITVQVLQDLESV